MPAIQTTGLTKYYGDVRGIEDLSFTVREGEVFGFLGPNGAGKTTTIRTLLGFLSPTAGTATVLGAEVGDAAALRAARARVGYLPSEPGLTEDVTGRRLLEYHGSLRGDVRSEELLELFDPPLDRRVGAYSRGNRQMLAIVMAFMHDPELVIMDEPTAGLDPLRQERFLEFVRAERDRGRTFLFSSHVLSEVRKVCDRAGIVRDGRLVALEDVAALVGRSGKTVRATVAGDVTAAAVDLEGAHDVAVDGQGPPGGGPEEPADRDGDADTHTAADGTTTLSFTYTGAYEPLLRHLLRFDLRDLTVEEAPLEEVFMRFYDEDPAEAVEDTAPTPARTARREAEEADDA